MPDELNEEEKLARILQRDPRYKREAYRFIQEALEYTVKKSGKRGHVGGRELALGCRDLALERFGFLAKTVLNQWGIQQTRDFGELVFNMVEEKIMVKKETDTKGDFEKVFDFEEVFVRGFELGLEG